jgi:uncharacterized protein YxeA
MKKIRFIILAIMFSSCGSYGCMNMRQYRNSNKYFGQINTHKMEEQEQGYYLTNLDYTHETE